MNILLTGGAGYIGSSTSYNLIEKGHDVTIIDNLENGNLKLIPKDSCFIESDISNAEKIGDLLKKKKFDLIMHFAAYTRVAESVKFPEKYFINNFEKAKIFFDICINNGLKKIIFSSTGAIYGTSDEKYLKEDKKPNPIKNMPVKTVTAKDVCADKYSFSIIPLLNYRSGSSGMISVI